METRVWEDIEPTGVNEIRNQMRQGASSHMLISLVCATGLRTDAG